MSYIAPQGEQSTSSEITALTNLTALGNGVVKKTGLNTFEITTTGTGDMLASTYDPSGISEQLVGLTSSQILTNKTLTSPVISSPTGLNASDVGLGNVENTALSTWAGSANITTLGTIGTGTWQGGVIGTAYGGTGVANGANNTITFTGNYTLGLTLSDNTAVTLPTSGTLVETGVTALNSLAGVSTALTGVLRADSGTLSVDTDVTDIVAAASLIAAGKVELATTTEIDTGTDTERAMPIDQFVASKRNIRWLVFNLVEAGTDCAIATNIAGDFVSPIAGTILQSDTTPFYLYATNSTAGTTDNMVVDISIGGTSIMTTNKLSFDSTEKTTTTSATPPDLTTTALAVGDIITIDIDSIHTTAAKGLTVYIGIRE